MKLSRAMALCLLLCLNALAGGAVEHIRNGVQLQAGDVNVKVQFYAEGIVRVVKWPAGGTPDKVSLSVIQKDVPEVSIHVDDTADAITLGSDQVTVLLQKSDGSIRYLDNHGATVLDEQGKATFAPTHLEQEKAAFNVQQDFKLTSEEGIYGLGQHQSGYMNYRGRTVKLVQSNTDAVTPFFVSTAGYGVFWDNYSKTIFTDTPQSTSMWSEVADNIDYYFIYGPTMDQAIAGYRQVTGQAPMYGKWAYGYWQSKEHYATRDELLGIAQEYRKRRIPIDNVVQDWNYWGGNDMWGALVFDESKYPRPKEMIDLLHQQNFHLMISIWPFFEPGSANYDFMDKKGWFIDKFKFAKPPFHTDAMAAYDATSADARKFYWDQVDKGLFNIGLDAWWMDTTEPETEGQEENIQLGHKLAIGSGDRYVNAYPLLDTEAVYDGQRAASDQKRVYILSRSAFAGSQRNAVTAWSGDINSDWFSYRRQIPAGLNFALSGIPYWTTDIGGFVFGSPTDPAFRELFIRWFQFGTFNPILRVHGTRDPDENELWSYGPDAQKILVSFDRLRYRLLPYTYSLAWKTTNDSYTPMRPLVMDFRSDVRAENTWDEFMYGPAFLVNPVTEPAATSRRVYLPKANANADAKWYDFWSGVFTEGALETTAEAPLDRLPLYVRAGSIVPLGPDVEWSTEKPADPIELRIYRGADGEFTLYEDENDNYNYEKGIHATIPFRWDDAKQVLTIADRQGQFPGMLASRTFRVVFVGENHGVGIAPCDSADKIVQYSGKQITVTP